MPDPDELMIGTFAGGTAGMVTISSLGLGTYSPKIAEGAFTIDPAHYSGEVTLGDGTQREVGWLQSAWHINGLRGQQYTDLIVYRTGHSSKVYIRTLDNDSKTFKNYLCVMIWPVKPNRGDPTAVEDGVVQDFELKFIQMVEQ